MYATVVVSLLSCISSCGKDEKEKDGLDGPDISSVFMEDAAVLTVGESITLKYIVKPSDADYSIEWKSSNSDIASVDSKGRVTAQAEGKATIKGVFSGNSGTEFEVTCKIIVREEETEGANLRWVIGSTAYTNDPEAYPKGEYLQPRFTMYEGDKFITFCQDVKSEEFMKKCNGETNSSVIKLSNYVGDMGEDYPDVEILALIPGEEDFDLVASDPTGDLVSFSFHVSVLPRLYWLKGSWSSSKGIINGETVTLKKGETIDLIAYDRKTNDEFYIQDLNKQFTTSGDESNPDVAYGVPMEDGGFIQIRAKAVGTTNIPLSYINKEKNERFSTVILVNVVE